MHATAYYLNPHFHYEPKFKVDDSEVKDGLYTLVKDVAERKKKCNFLSFIMLEDIFTKDDAKECRKALLPEEWLKMFGDGTTKLKRFDT